VILRISSRCKVKPSNPTSAETVAVWNGDTFSHLTVVGDYAAFVTRPSISVRSATKSIGFVRSASAPPSMAFLLVLSSP
jgi:hypothetical protein